MITDIFFFAFYFSLALFVIYLLSRRSSRFALNFKQASLVFGVKVLVGCLYGYFFLHYYNGDDTWFYHNEGLKEYALLRSDPWTFFTRDLFTSGYSSNQLFTIFDASNSFSKDLQETLLIKVLALFDLFSGGRYYVNVIFYNIFVCWGSYYLYLTLLRNSPGKRSLWFLFIFFFPPLVFWTSGIRKDGFSFALMGAYIYQVYYLIETRRMKYYLLAFVTWLLLFFSRSFIAMSLVPVTVAWLVAAGSKRRKTLVYAAVLVAFAAAFFLTVYLPDSFNLPLKVAERQNAFMRLSGNSYLPMGKLAPTLSSYLAVLPAAMNHIFLRPYPTEAGNPLYLLSCLEIVFFFALLLLAVMRSVSNRGYLIGDPLVLSLFAIAFINYLLIGFTVPFLGAFVRYRSVFEIFFLLALLHSINTSFRFKRSA